MAGPNHHRFPKLVTPMVFSLVLVASGCGYVKRDDFESEVTQLRADMQAEMRAGDAALASRVDGVENRLSTLETELQDLETEFGATVERMEQALRVHAPVHFGFDQADLDSNEVPVLDRLGAVLREHYPEALITVEGFTDPSGSAAYNKRLGQRRADTVRDYLMSSIGLGDAQVRSVSYGEDTARLVRPDAAGPGEMGRENRRVVIVIDHPNAWQPTATVANSGTE